LLPKTRKVYCYVDETGQDTLGRFFIVSVVVSGENRHSLIEKLEQIERASGKGKVKWIHTRHRARLAYIKSVLTSPAFKNSLYFSLYCSSRSYMALTVLSTAKALLSAAPEHDVVTVYVDGLPKARLRWFGVELRRLSVRNSNVSGIRREETDALIRLADACCGFVRLALLAKEPEVLHLFEQAKKESYLREV
jgi:hypothetical protein